MNIGIRIRGPLAVACALMMLFVPLAALASTMDGTVRTEEHNGKSNTVGNADVELYNYASIDTSEKAGIIESQELTRTERLLELPGKTTLTPVNATEPEIRMNSNDSTPARKPDAVFTDVASQVGNGEVVNQGTWTGVPAPTSQAVDGQLTDLDPAFNLDIEGNVNDSLAGFTPPPGVPAVQATGNDSTPSLSIPTGTAPTSAQTDNATLSLVQPTGAEGIQDLVGNASRAPSAPAGVAGNLVKGYDGIMTNTPPSGSHSIDYQVVNLTPVGSAPTGVSVSASGTYYVGNLTVDGNETGIADSTVFLTLVDVAVAGTYDTLEMSMGDVIFGQGTLADTIVQVGNDETVTPSPGAVVLGNAPLFHVEFDPNPTADDDDVRISTEEWYTGSFQVDADSDGLVDDTVYFSVYDENSDGVFDSLELSLGDTAFGEGDLEDSRVLSNNDETINNTLTELGKYGPDDAGYSWTDEAEYDWVDINGTGTNINLTDDDHQSGVDLGFDFTYYGSTYNNTTISSNGFLSFNESDTRDLDHFWWFGDVPMRDGIEGPLCFMCMDLNPNQGTNATRGYVTYDTLGTAPNRYFITQFTNIQEFGGGNNRTAQIILYEGTNSIKMQWRSLADDLDIIGIEHVNESTGIGTNANGDLWINVTNITNGTAYGYYPGGSVGLTTVAIGDYSYRFEVNRTPSVATDDLNFTSVDWFTEPLHFDSDGDGQPDDSLYYLIRDTDSNGIFETLDLSTNASFGVGNLANLMVNDTEDERLDHSTVPATVTLGTDLPFDVDFDLFPAQDESDIRITALRWYEGSVVVDADDDGVADDTVYYVLTDSDSDGSYDTVDVSLHDQTFGEGNLTDGNVSTAGDDERFQLGADVFLGPSIVFSMSTTGAPTTSSQDLSVLNQYTFKGNMSFDTDGDGVADDDLFFVISDQDSDGIYDAIDLSFDLIFGEGNVSNRHVGLNPYDDARITVPSSIELGDDMLYNISFDPDPQSDNEDMTMTAEVWFRGTFMIDADNDGVVSESLHYTLTDSDSDGFFDVMDLSLADETFGQGGLDDSTVGSGDDERVYAPETVSVGSLNFMANFSGSPAQAGRDGVLTNTDLYTGSVTLDTGWDGTANDMVHFAISDADSDGLYDTLDLSLGNDEYREDLTSDGYVDEGNNDEWMVATGPVRIGFFQYNVSFVPNPQSAGTDMELVSQQWYEGDLPLDADADGLVNETVHFVISDMDSNGVYDRMDLSIGDSAYGEGDASDGGLASDDDETVTGDGQVEIDLGELLLGVRFSPSPNQNSEDVWLKNLRWYTGTISGAQWTVHFAACDQDSDGTYDVVEMSNDGTFGQGDGGDMYLKNTNDEVLTDGEMLIKGDYHLEVFLNSTMAGEEDVGLKSVEWRTGQWTVEGNIISVAVSDADSDMFMDTIHLDMNDDGSYDGPDDLSGGMEGFKGDLMLEYAVAESNEDGTRVWMVPANATVEETDAWMIGTVVLGDVPATVAVSDTDDDGVFETADMDLDVDGVLDVTGMTEANGVFAEVQGTGYQIMVSEKGGEMVRVVPYTGAIVDPSLDRSVDDELMTGSVTEITVGADINDDGDMADVLNVVVIRKSSSGPLDKRYDIIIDRDLEGDLTDDEPLSLGQTVEMDNGDWTIDHLSDDADHVGLMRITGSSASATTTADGSFEVQPDVPGTYWVAVSSPREQWGYALYEDTNGHMGYQISTKGITDKEVILVGTGSPMGGEVTDMITGEPIGGVLVEVYNMDKDLVVSTLSLQDGTYRISVRENRVYDVVFSKEGYLPDDGTLRNGTWHGFAVGDGDPNVDVSLMPDPAPDIMEFTEPGEGEVLTGTVDVTVEVTDTVDVDGMMLTVNNGISWSNMSAITDTTYTFQWDTTQNPDGTYSIIARATNYAGLRADKGLDVIVDNGGPVVDFKSAPDQYGNVLFEVRVSDDFSDVDKVEISVDGGPYEKMSKDGDVYTHSWFSGPFDSGKHSYKVKATDSRDNTETYEDEVGVDNTWMLLLILVVVMGIVLGVVIMKKRGGKEEEDTTAPPVPPETDTSPSGPMPPEGAPGAAPSPIPSAPMPEEGAAPAGPEAPMPEEGAAPAGPEAPMPEEGAAPAGPEAPMPEEGAAPTGPEAPMPEEGAARMPGEGASEEETGPTDQGDEDIPKEGEQ